VSTIELHWRNRKIGTAQSPRRFLDLVIDGESLYDKVGDFISPLGWQSDSENRKAVDRFLRRTESDFPGNRMSIFICPECGDLGCGAVSAVIEREGGNIVWRDFGYQNNYDDAVHREDLEDLGPFTFNATEYYNEFIKALETGDEKGETS